MSKINPYEQAASIIRIADKKNDKAWKRVSEKDMNESIMKQMADDQREILSWCSSLEEAKLNGEFEHKPEDSYFLKQVKTICQLATIDIKE